MTHKTVYTSVEVDVDIGDFDDEDIRDEYENRFGDETDYNEDFWIEAYAMRRKLTDEQFLKYLDVVIMNNTGRIL